MGGSIFLVFFSSDWAKKVFHYHHQLLHEVSRSGAFGVDHQEQSPGLQLEIDYQFIRTTP